MAEASKAPDRVDLEVAGDGSSKKVREGVVADVGKAEIGELEGTAEEAKVEHPKPSSSSSVDIVGGATLQDCPGGADANIQESGCKEDRRTTEYQISSATVVDGQSQVYLVEANQEGGRELEANHDSDNISPQADLIAKDPVLEDPVVMEVCSAHILDVGQDSSHKILTSLADTNRNIQEDLIPCHGSPRPEPADPVVTVQTKVTGGKAGDESMLNLHKDGNQEASVTQDPTDSITADDKRGGQADHVTEETHPSDSIVEVRHQEMGGETEASLKPTMDDNQRRDQKASFSPKDLLPDTTVLDAVHVDDTLGPQADHGIVDKTLTDTVPAVQPQVREEGSDRSFDSNPVGDIIDHQADFVSEDANQDDPSIKSQDKMRNIESDVDKGLMMKGDEVRLVHEVPTLQISSVQTTPGLQEGDTRLKSNKIDDGTGSREGLRAKDQVIADTEVEILLQENRREMEAGDVHMVDADQGSSCEASASQTSSVDTNRNIQEGSIALELVPFDGPVTHQDGHATASRDPEPEVSAGSDVDEGREGDSEASASRPSLLETNQHIHGEGNIMLNSVDVDGAVDQQTDRVTEDKNLIAREGIITTLDVVTNLCVAEAGNEGANSVSGNSLGSGHSLITDVHLAQNIVESAAVCPDPQPSHENTTIKGDIIKLSFGNVEDNSYGEDQEASVSMIHLMDNTKEDDTLMGLFSIGNTDHQADCATQDPNDSCLELQRKIKHIDSDVSTMEGGGDKDHEPSMSRTFLPATNQNVQEESDNVFDSASLEAVHLMNDPDQATPHIEVKPTILGREAEISDGTEMDADQERDRATSHLMASLVETNRNILGEVHGDANSGNDGQLGSRYPVLSGASLAHNVLDLAAENADTRQFDENAIVQGDSTNADANHVTELQSEGIQLTDKNPDGEEDIAELVSCSVGEKEDVGTGSLGEKLIVTRDTVMQNSNSEMGISALSEIQDVLSEGKESIELPYDTNQNIVIQSVGTSVDGDLGANSHKLESSLGKSLNSATDLEVIKNDMPPPTACFKTVESIQESELKQETSNPSNTRNVLMDEGMDGKPVIQVGKGELLKGTDKQAVQCVATNTKLSIMEKKQHISYNLPSLDKTNFFISDLVWGKVKSHPWWPGQIIDPSDASRLALKYQKKDNFLVAYFGDKTFAWCDSYQLKSFYSYYSQMEKQCNADTFVIGVNEILGEISRRVELGMACSCLPEEDCANIKFQKVDNAGVRKGNITSVLDRPLILNYFQPSELIEYIKTLAQFPNVDVDRLELVLATSQLKAFYASKGYPELPVFTVERELMEDVDKISPSNVERSGEYCANHYNPVLSDLIYSKRKSRSKEKSFKKRKLVPEDDRKYKSMSDLTDEENALHLGYGGESKFSVEDSENLTPSFVTKNTTFGSDSVEKGKHKRTLDFFGDVEPASPSPAVTSSFKIGEFIRRAASQLTVAPPIIKRQQGTSQKKVPQADRNQGDVTDFDVLPHAPPDEMLSQLCLTAIYPLNGNDFVSMMVAFFTSFRNSCVSCTPVGNKPAEKHKRGRPRKVISQTLFSELFSDISSSEDKNVEKRKRSRSKQLDSKPVISDISSSEKQHDNKCSSQDQHVQKRRRGRPKKVILKPAISDISSSEEKQHAEKPKRGRPKKVTSQLASSPDHMQDSYWSGTKLQKRPRRKSFSDDHEQKVESHKKIQQKKFAGERPISLLSGSMMENEQLQVVPTNLNTKYSLVAERPIICVKEKVVEEPMPTALILSFSSSGTLPSVTDLIRIFSRYGPLKEAETEVLRKSNRAKVVFKRLADAEAAFSRAGSTFGSGLISYQLKYMPGSPKPTCETNPLVQNDATSTAKPKENHETASLITPQDDHNPATLVTPHKHDEAPMAAPQDEHDTTPAYKPQDDSGPISTPQNEKGPMQVCNVEISELSPCDKYDSTSIPQAEDNHGTTSTAMPQAEHDSTVITASGDDYHDAAPITTTDDKYSATQIESSDLPQDKHDVMLINETWVDRDASFIAAPQDSHNATLDTGSQDYQYATPTTALPERAFRDEDGGQVDITLAEAEGIESSQ